MALKRHFFPDRGGEPIEWLPVMPGERRYFRDYSSANSLGRLVAAECSLADSGGAIELFSSEIRPVEEAEHLVIPIIELELVEGIITLEEGEEYPLPIISIKHGAGTVLFQHDNKSTLRPMDEAA
ncbi:MAG TPA: hypothetical protein VFH37_02765 [Candidatus Saccharimonadales bacterium]|nr:hypothetical protein [Candidatus Saccharimonadales bacterium]